MFKVRVHESDGNAFESLFTTVMRYSDKGFKPVKPQGRLGDRKNDGFIKEKGTYYQVFAPENLKRKTKQGYSQASRRF